MHTQQEVLDKTTSKLTQVELQNAELVGLLAKAVDSSSWSAHYLLSDI